MKNLLNYQEMMTMQQKIYRLFVSSKPKLIGSDLRQRNTSIPQQINFWGKLKDDDGAAMFLIAEKTKKKKKKSSKKILSIFQEIHWLYQHNITIEHQKILNWLNEANHSKFVTRKRHTVNDQSNENYDVGN